MKVASTSQQKSPSLYSLMRGLPSTSASPDLSAELSSEPDSEPELPPSSSPGRFLDACWVEAACPDVRILSELRASSCSALAASGAEAGNSVDSTIGALATIGGCITVASKRFCSFSALSFFDFFVFSFIFSLSPFLLLCGTVSAGPAASGGRFAAGTTCGAGFKADGRAGGAGLQPSGNSGGGALPTLGTTCPGTAVEAAVETAGLGAIEPGCMSCCSTRISSNAFWICSSVRPKLSATTSQAVSARSTRSCSTLLMRLGSVPMATICNRFQGGMSKDAFP
mmetsp:Transcript_48376/g.113213  ORF Transcript_48376/g.113213 Transcript_48376/m.113213 type:complete len:282 (-) Transcript_48376:267-1112(-)